MNSASNTELVLLVGDPAVLAGLVDIVPYHTRSTGGVCQMIASTSADSLSRAAAAGCEVARLHCDLSRERPLIVTSSPAANPPVPGYRLLFANSLFQAFAGPLEASGGNHPPDPAPGRTDEAPMAFRALALSFRVSLNEEHVDVQVEVGGCKHSLGARLHNYFLLTLARVRLSDPCKAAGEAGWIERDALCKMMGRLPPSVNLDIFRIRRQFRSLGVRDADQIIERRKDSRELRIGVDKLEVASCSE